MSRSPYHHGNLRDALVDAGGALAASNGPAGVTVRAAAREVGVTPTAAYRHFAGQAELLEAVKEAALARLADYIRTAIATVEQTSVAEQTSVVEQTSGAAVDRLRASGEAYVRFAVEQPGLFQVAFCQTAADAHSEQEADAFRLLGSALDELESLGYLSTRAREGGEYIAWAVVHGLAHLSLSGPLAQMPPAERDQLVDRALQVLTRGLRSADTGQTLLSSMRSTSS